MTLEILLIFLFFYHNWLIFKGGLHDSRNSCDNHRDTIVEWLSAALFLTVRQGFFTVHRWFFNFPLRFSWLSTAIFFDCPLRFFSTVHCDFFRLSTAIFFDCPLRFFRLSTAIFSAVHCGILDFLLLASPLLSQVDLGALVLNLGALVLNLGAVVLKLRRCCFSLSPLLFLVASSIALSRHKCILKRERKNKPVKTKMINDLCSHKLD